MTSSVDTQGRMLADQLHKAAENIQLAAQNLERVFANANTNLKESGKDELPDPIKLIKRMTALEIALGSLKEESATVARKRSEVVQKVIATQCETVSQVKKLLEQTENEDPYSSRDDIIDENLLSISL
eukprot:CAMPEP_0176124684 /NCGR_PEP_ID=MMETSP0120_2-20121206/62871_1 /TAXON_ID=160619 /ORGANISM="Kryptoperidinium foliaceum, Strain CCMP 1326" /LENGTH=127 /DNA_ID=CAMNT_0017459475 /DNA_START=15 /DNA_END=398 /DNA_ORIENTATION=+